MLRNHGAILACNQGKDAPRRGPLAAGDEPLDMAGGEKLGQVPVPRRKATLGLRRK